MVEHIADELFYVYHDLFSPIQDAYTKIRNIPDGMMLIEITLLKIAKWEWKSVKTEEKIEKKIEPSETRFLPSQEWRNPTIVKTVNSREWQEASISKNPAPQELSKTPISDKPLWVPVQEPKKILTIDIGDWVTHSNNQSKPFSFPAFIMGLKATTLMSDVKWARFELADNIDENKKTLHLTFSKKWNFDRVNIAKSKNILVESLQNLFGGNWSIECTLDSSADNSLHNAVHEIF